jgi:Domain of unknown function (DUF4399)
MRVVTVLLALACSAAAIADQTAAPAGAAVYIVKPVAGARVKSPVTVVFGLTGMGIAPAGVKFDNTGHHHLLIDTELPSDLTQPLPVSDNIRHFGKGQTEATLDLPPGKHTLQLLFADFTHTPFTPNVTSKKITITVTK